MTRVTSVPRDGCVVDTRPLGAMVSSFVNGWNRRSEATAGRFTRHGTLERGPLRWLAVETGVPKKTIESVISGRSRTTELATADHLVAALGHPQAFHDGTLTVRPNPRASKEAQAACCGGSLTGDAASR